MERERERERGPPNTHSSACIIAVLVVESSGSSEPLCSLHYICQVAGVEEDRWSDRVLRLLGYLYYIGCKHVLEIAHGKRM